MDWEVRGAKVPLLLLVGGWGWHRGTVASSRGGRFFVVAREMIGGKEEFERRKVIQEREVREGTRFIFWWGAAVWGWVHPSPWRWGTAI